jgi:hypothetical protein
MVLVFVFPTIDLYLAVTRHERTCKRLHTIVDPRYMCFCRSAKDVPIRVAMVVGLTRVKRREFTMAGALDNLL